MQISNDSSLPIEIVGSWSCWYGEQDQVGKSNGVNVY